MSFDAIESICVVPGDGFNELWMVVDREGGRYIERMALRLEASDVAGVMTSRVEEALFLDAAVTYNGASATEFAGVLHLDGETVGILADGVVLDQQVVDGNIITLSSAASIVLVGLPYNCDFETLNVEVPLKEGTIQSRKVKIGNVTFRLKDTRGGWVGPDSSNIYEAFTQQSFRESSGENLSATELFTGDVRQPLGAQYSQGGRVFYRQVDPLPVTIGAIVPEVSVGGASR